MADNIRTPSTHVKIKSNSLHESVKGTVVKDYINTILLKMDPDFEKYKHSYKSRLGHFNLKPGQKATDYMEGKYLMVKPDALIEIPKD